MVALKRFIIMTSILIYPTVANARVLEIVAGGTTEFTAEGSGVHCLFSIGLQTTGLECVGPSGYRVSCDTYRPCHLLNTAEYKDDDMSDFISGSGGVVAEPGWRFKFNTLHECTIRASEVACRSTYIDKAGASGFVANAAGVRIIQ